MGFYKTECSKLVIAVFMKGYNDTRQTQNGSNATIRRIFYLFGYDD